MSDAHPEGLRITAVLARDGEAQSAAQIAQAVITAWHAIDDTLTPVIGAGGLVALYLRALHLAAADPGVSAVGDPGRLALSATTSPALLQALIARQSPAHALAIGSTFLQVFHGLLASLIGPSLTERLLRAVWTPSPISIAAQDTPP